MKLKIKLMIWIFILGLIPIIFLTIFSIIQTNQVETKIKEKLISDRLIQLQTRINEWIESITNQIKLVDKNIVIKDVITTILNEDAGNNAYLDETVTLPYGKDYIINYFNEIINTSNRNTGKSFSEFFVLNKQGEIVVTTNPTKYPEKTLFNKASFFTYYIDENLIEKGTISGIFGPLSPEQTKKNKDEICFALTSRITDSKNNFIGLIVAFTNSQKLNKIMKYEKSQEEGLPFISYLFDEKEKAISYPITEDLELTAIENFIGNKIVVKNTNQTVEPIKDSINTSYRSTNRQILKQSYKNFEGKTVYGGWFWISVLPIVRFGGVVELPVTFIESFISIRSFVYIIVGFILSGLMLFIANSISNYLIAPIKNATSHISKITNEGNIPKEQIIKRKDEIGDLLSTIEKLISFIRRVIIFSKGTSTEITKSSQIIIEKNNELSTKTDNIMDLSLETATSMEKMTSLIKENAANATKAKQQSHQTIDTASIGKEKVIKTMTSINNIDNFSKKISEIILVMDNIAFQTNLLSLNAAVESARSGEHGKGFSVLSAEIRSLAQRSKKAAKQISELINTTGEKVDEAVQFGNESTKVFYKILKEAQAVTSIIEDSAKISLEEEQGVEQINQLIMKMEEIGRKDSELIDTISTQNKNILENAEKLIKFIMNFRLEEDNGKKILQLPEKNENIDNYEEKDNELFDEKPTTTKKEKINKETSEITLEEPELENEGVDFNNAIILDKPEEEEVEEEEVFLIDDNILPEDIVQPIQEKKKK